MSTSCGCIFCWSSSTTPLCFCPCCGEAELWLQSSWASHQILVQVFSQQPLWIVILVSQAASDSVFLFLLSHSLTPWNWSGRLLQKSISMQYMPIHVIQVRHGTWNMHSSPATPCRIASCQISMPSLLHYPLRKSTSPGKRIWPLKCSRDHWKAVWPLEGGSHARVCLSNVSVIP